MATEQQIRELAYSIWEQEGRPNGKDWEHYYTARRILEEREASPAQSGDPAPAQAAPLYTSAPEPRRKIRRR